MSLLENYKIWSLLPPYATPMDHTEDPSIVNFKTGIMIKPHQDLKMSSGLVEIAGARDYSEAG